MCHERCFVSKGAGVMVDTLRPGTNVTHIYGKTLDQCREKYPDIEEMSVNEFCAWKAEQPRTPVKWELTTEEKFFKAMEVLPPADQIPAKGFLVGEPMDSDALTGAPRFQAFRRKPFPLCFYVSSRPLTRKEFRAEMAKA